VKVKKPADSDAAPVNQSAILHCVPLFHVTGSHSGFLMSIIAGRKMVMMPKWDAGAALKLIQDEKIAGNNWCSQPKPGICSRIQIKINMIFQLLKSSVVAGLQDLLSMLKSLKMASKIANHQSVMVLTETNAAGNIKFRKRLSVASWQLWSSNSPGY
jgi:acyl-CoA synthetase (AMP-forming)/AMP-acid ligase II